MGAVQTPGDSKARGTAREGVKEPRVGESPERTIDSPYWVVAVTEKRSVRDVDLEGGVGAGFASRERAARRCVAEGDMVMKCGREH